MELLQKAYDDILKLRSANVSIFGQDTKLNDNIDEFTIDVLEVLEVLREHEVKDLQGYDNVDDYLNHLIEVCFIEKEPDKSDNSYNWNSNISNDFNYHSYTAIDGTVFIEFAVHRYGDVRSNYTEPFLLNFDTVDDFLCTLLESNLYKTIEIKGTEYSLYCTVFDEGLEVSNVDGCYIMTTYETEKESIIQDILSELEQR